jgi:two-component system chemotaxis response regulator CheY
MPTVLVIDDHAYMRALLRSHFEEMGFQVLSAEDGREGLAVMRRESVDLVVSDILMPGTIEGIELIATARELLPNTPIIAISAGGKSGAESYLDTAMALGATTSLGKPFSLDDLIEVVREAMPEPSPAPNY